MSRLLQLKKELSLARRQLRAELHHQFPAGSVITASVGGHINEFEIIAHLDYSIKDGCIRARNLKNQKVREFSFTRILGFDFSEHDEQGQRQTAQHEVAA